MKRLMSGNEAIALGAYQAGVKVASAYPGTPSTEILENFARYPGIYAEWAANEKVALDVGVGAAYSGVRALVAMKHVGLNVAADSLFYASYTGLRAGLVVVTADDPGLYSSQNEQDNRHYARFAKVPMLEPADSEEARRFVGLALEISERYDTPALLRTTTRVSHSKSLVEAEEAAAASGAGPAGEVSFRRDPAKLVMIPAYARRRHPVVEERMASLARFAETFPENRIEMGDPRLGIVASGVAFQYAREVFPRASFLKLGMAYPLPEGLIRSFAARVERLVVLEELDPFYEEAIRALGLQVTGKAIFPAIGEFNPQLVRSRAAAAGLPLVGSPEELNLAGSGTAREEEGPPGYTGGSLPELPARPPLLCPGCGHRGVFYALRRLGVVVFGDIGCYTLGVMPPLAALDTCGCMGASIGVLHGAGRAGIKERAVAVIGDSTFFHSGLAPLVSLIYNRGSGVTIIMDNRITAMTGHQDHPGTGRTLMGEEAPRVDLEAVVRGLGVEQVATLNPYDVEAVRRTVKGFLDSGRAAVIIARHPCVLYTREKHPPAVVDAAACTNCKVCLRLGCPPLVPAGDKVEIDQLLCNGCGLCVRVCPYKAIRVPETATRGGDGIAV